MTKIQIEIDTCMQCPYFKITKVSSTDGFDRGEDWHCNKVDKQIMPFVEWNDKVEIPEWCPVIIER